MKSNQKLRMSRAGFFLPTAWGLLLLATTYLTLYLGAARMDIQGLQREIHYWQHRKAALLWCKETAITGRYLFETSGKVRVEKKLDKQGAWCYLVTYPNGEKYQFYLEKKA